MSTATSSSSSSSHSQEPMSSYTHYALDQPVTMFSVIDKMRYNNQLCDVFLRVGKSVTKAHRLVLASGSPYFYAMFNIDMTEKSQAEVELHDIDSGALQLLVEFLYTNQVVITEKNVQNLFSTSSFLQINSVQDACCTFMIKQLRPTNCLGTRRFAELYSYDVLIKETYLYVLNNFEAVAKCEEFLDLSFSEVENVVSEDKLCVLSEEKVYVAVIRWIKHDIAERSQYIAQLFGHVRLAQLSKKFLFNVVYNEPLVWNEPSCSKMWVDALKYQDIPDERSDLPRKRTEQRLGGLGVFTIGGRCGDTFYRNGECYDVMNDRWLSIGPMSEFRNVAGISSLGGLIYAIGGRVGRIWSSAECYDPISNKWSFIKSMNSNRCEHGISTIDGLLYVCGGFNGSSVLDTVERYDPLTDIWLSCPSMTTRRKNCCVTAFNNCLYALGGSYSTTYLSSVERYDPRTSKWMVVPEMSCMRSGFSVATLDNTLYCVGGKKDPNTRLSCGERFNIRRNIWEPIAHMQQCRAFHGMVGVNGKLLVLGGYDGESVLRTTERYNPWNNQWTTATPMQTQRSEFGTALLYCCDIDFKRKLASKNTHQL